MDDKLIIQSRKNYGKGKPVSVRLPKKLLKEIDRVALETGRTRSEIIFICLEFALSKIDTELKD